MVHVDTDVALSDLSLDWGAPKTIFPNPDQVDQIQYLDCCYPGSTGRPIRDIEHKTRCKPSIEKVGHLSLRRNLQMTGSVGNGWLYPITVSYVPIA